MERIADAVGLYDEELLENLALTPTFKKETAIRLAKLRSDGGRIWDESEEVAAAYGFLKRQFDPYRLVELAPFLSWAPFFGGLIYLSLLFVQGQFPDFFPPAYVLGAGVILGPILAIYLKGG